MSVIYQMQQFLLPTNALLNFTENEKKTLVEATIFGNLLHKLYCSIVLFHICKGKKIIGGRRETTLLTCCYSPEQVLQLFILKHDPNTVMRNLLTTVIKVSVSVSADGSMHHCLSTPVNTK